MKRERCCGMRAARAFVKYSVRVLVARCGLMWAVALCGPPSRALLLSRRGCRCLGVICMWTFLRTAPRYRSRCVCVALLRLNLACRGVRLPGLSHDVVHCHVLPARVGDNAFLFGICVGLQAP